jgi:hypothetical protein
MMLGKMLSRVVSPRNDMDFTLLSLVLTKIIWRRMWIPIPLCQKKKKLNIVTTLSTIVDDSWKKKT